MKQNILIILIFIFSCTAKPADSEINTVSVLDSTNTQTEIIETFVDSVNIGEKGKNKIELIKHRVFDDTYVIVNFIQKTLKLIVGILKTHTHIPCYFPD